MMSSYSELLRRRYGERLDSDARDFIEYIASGADRMKRLINDLLLYSRLERSAVPLKQVRLDGVLDDALANLANAIERSGAVVERGPLPEVMGEPTGLTQVFQNLIGNAIKFTARDTRPQVRISASEDETNWIVSVSDNGIGIAPEHFERIFIIFQRLHAQDLYEGTGMGLTICKKVVDRHGGRIVVDSAPGQGTTFTVRLPKTT
jgi:light-regulated signal transduction histidine kinase (bacteriophytochrome)